MRLPEVYDHLQRSMQMKGCDQSPAARKQRLKLYSLFKHKTMKKVTHDWVHYNMKGNGSTFPLATSGKRAVATKPAMRTCKVNKAMEHSGTMNKQYK